MMPLSAASFTPRLFNANTVRFARVDHVTGLGVTSALSTFRPVIMPGPCFNLRRRTDRGEPPRAPR